MNISRFGLFKALIAVLPLLMLVTCETPEQPEEVKPDIQVPSSSQQVFSSGILFGASSGNLVQSFAFSFTATDSWTADITETRASSWLSVEPSSGGAGTVNMTVMALANPSEEARSATVTLQCGEVKKAFTVHQEGAAAVTPPPSGVVPVSSITLNKTSLYLEKDQMEQLTATVKPDNATNKDVSWSSSDESVAIVDRDGKVTGVWDGNATITATADGKSATCAVTVTVVIPVESITLDYTSLTLSIGGSATLTATVKPDNASDKTVVWSSSNSAIASVDQNGTVTALAEGRVEIKASAGGKEAICPVTVLAGNVGVKALSLNRISIHLEPGQQFTLIPFIFPENATDKNVEWSVGNTNMATVKDGVVSAVKAYNGYTTLTASAAKGRYKAQCLVWVMDQVIPVTGLSLNKTSLSLTTGESETLVATISPSNASEDQVSWRSSNPDCATVNEKTGQVSALQEGTTVITAGAGDYEVSCTLTVNKKVVAVSGISVSPTQIRLKVGESATVKATVKPDTATDQTVTWTTSNKSAVTVEGQGEDNKQGLVKVVGRPSGSDNSVVISAKAGGWTATCSVIVE